MLEVLDTAGQEELTALRDQWIRSAEGFVIVYSISSRLLFSRIENFQNQIWRVRESSVSSLWYTGSPISSVTPSAPISIMLVGNKSDKVTEREVFTYEGQALAQKLGCGFLEASAKNCIAVEDAFYNLVRQLRRQRIQDTARQIQRTSRWPRMGIGDEMTLRDERIYRHRKDERKCMIL